MADLASTLLAHLAQHKQRGILLDTNVLLLFLVASFCPKMIGGKRLERYTQQDGQLLWQFVTKFDRILTTQHILAETSNLARQAVKGTQWTAFSNKLYPLFCLDSQDSLQKIPIHDGKVKPRNGGWTGSSTQFTDFPARRDADAACMLLGGATTLERRETSNRACSAFTKLVTTFSPNSFIKSKLFRRYKRSTAVSRLEQFCVACVFSRGYGLGWRHDKTKLNK